MHHWDWPTGEGFSPHTNAAIRASVASGEALCPNLLGPSPTLERLKESSGARYGARYPVRRS
jgi:hypothetical protein